MKYHIQQLQDEAIRRLEICFPTQDLHFREAMNCFGTDYFSNTSFLMRLDDSITLFNLARKYDLKGILIRALTVFCRLELPKLLQGVVDSCGVHQSLSQDDLLRVLEGRDVLRRGCIDEDAMFDDTYHFECICEEGESNRFCEMGRCRMIEIFEEDYILGYEDFFEFIYNLEGIGKLLMCAGCYVEQVKTRNRIYNQVLDRVRKFLETPAQTVRLAS